MPRNKPRFNDLKDDMIKILKQGKDPKVDTDTAIAKFSQWYLDPSNRLPRDAASVRKTGGINTVALYPFSIPAAANCSHGMPGSGGAPLRTR
jgi:hypothetical protein